MGICGPTHDERSWTFDLDPGGVDPVLGIERLQQAYFARFPDYQRGITVPAIVDVPTGQVVTNDFAQMTLDLSTGVDGVPPRRRAGPLPRGAARRDRRGRRAGLQRRQQRRLPVRLRRSAGRRTRGRTAAVRPPRLARASGSRDQRYLVGDTITEADVRLFTTLARFDAVYHGHFKCNRQKLTEMPVLWAYARDLFQTPGFGDTTDFVQIKQHYYVVHRDINPTGIVPPGPDLAGWLTPHGREAARRPAVRRRHAAAAAGRRRRGGARRARRGADVLAG